MTDSELTASCEKEADDGKKVTTFGYRELAEASSNFDPKCFLGEGGFGKVHKGYLEKTTQVSEVYTDSVIICLYMMIWY